MNLKKKTVNNIPTELSASRIYINVRLLLLIILLLFYSLEWELSKRPTINSWCENRLCSNVERHLVIMNHLLRLCNMNSLEEVICSTFKIDVSSYVYQYNNAN